MFFYFAVQKPCHAALFFAGARKKSCHAPWQPELGSAEAWHVFYFAQREKKHAMPPGSQPEDGRARSIEDSLWECARAEPRPAKKKHAMPRAGLAGPKNNAMVNCFSRAREKKSCHASGWPGRALLRHGMFFISAKNNAELFFAWDPRALVGGIFAIHLKNAPLGQNALEKRASGFPENALISSQKIANALKRLHFEI